MLARTTLSSGTARRPGRGSSERRADGHLALPHRSLARSNCHVRTGDEQHEPDRTQEQPKAVDGLAAQEVVLSGSTLAPQPLFEAGGPRRSGGSPEPCPRSPGPWTRRLQTPHHQQPMKIVVDLVRGEGERQCRACFRGGRRGPRPGPRPRQGLAVEADRMPHDLAVPRRIAAPTADGSAPRPRSCRPVAFFRQEVAAQEGRDDPSW
jgi:hypothetical protein